MRANDQFETKLRTAGGIILNCDSVAMDIKYFQSAPKQLDDDIYESNYALLNRVYMYSWYFLTIELMKLYDDDGDFSLKKLLNIAINDYRKLELRHSMKIEKVKNYEKKLDEDLIILKSNDVKKFRDKHVAHLENKSIGNNPNIPLVDYEYLLMEAREIILNLAQSQFGWAVPPQRRAEGYFLFEDLNKRAK